MMNRESPSGTHQRGGLIHVGVIEGGGLTKNKILAKSQDFFHYTLTGYKEYGSGFAVEKPGRDGF